MESARFFIPCVADAVFSDDARAQRQLLRLAGYDAEPMRGAYCCGQPAATVGDEAGAAQMTSVWLDAAHRQQTIFVSSATCLGHLRQSGADSTTIRYTPDAWVAHITARSTFRSRRVYLHRPCHDVWDDDRWRRFERWFADTANVEPVLRPYEDPCCGFGGVFSTIFDRTAAAMTEHRVGALSRADVQTIVSAEPGCLGHFRAHARGIEVIPLATFLVQRGIG